MNNIENNTNLYSDAESSSSTSELLQALLRLLRIVRYRKNVVLCTFYCFALMGAAYYFTATRYYASSAKLLIVEQKPDQLSAMGDHDITGNTMATHRELVMSPVVIQAAIKRLSPQHRIDLQGKLPKEWTRTIAAGLGASITRKTNIIDVSYRSRNPETAAAVVSAIIHSYLDFVEKNHKGSASERITVLNGDREQIQNELTKKQVALQQMRQRVGHLATSSDDGFVEPMIQRAIHLNKTYLEAQEQRLSQQATLTSLEQSLARGEDISQQLMGVEANLGRQILLSSMGLSSQDMQVLSDQHKKLLAKQQELQSLSADLGPNHPKIIELTQQTQSLQEYLRTYHSKAGNRLNSMSESMPHDIVINMLRQSVRQAQHKEDQLHESFRLARTEAASHSDALVKMRMLERDITRNESRYDELSTQIANFDFSQLQAPIRATVVREPLPEEIPVSPHLRLVLVTCLLSSTLVGGAIAYVQDLLDDRFNSPEEMTTQLGVPVLAMVRNLEPLPGEGLESVYTNAMPNSVETEAFRTLRTAVSLSGNECDRLLISSSEPGDGKTTISANLSVAFAQAGKRTLVIDADLRRPGFTSLMNLKGQLGVADILASGQLPSETAPPLVHQTAVHGLDVLPVGRRRPNPAELLSSKTFVELLAWADSLYDRVIVDCPPVLAVSDAQIVGQLVDGAILVVRPEKNHRRSVIRSVESFHATGCRVLGVVANGLSNDLSGYGYGYGYGYAYGEEYGHDASEESFAPPTMPMHVTSDAPAYDNEMVIPTTKEPIRPALAGTPPSKVQPRRAA